MNSVNKESLDKAYKNFKQKPILSLLEDFKEQFFSYVKNVLALDIKEIERVRLEKKEERGGFEERLFCYLIVLKKGDPFISYYYKENKYYRINIASQEDIFKDCEAFSCSKLVRDNVASRAAQKNRVVFSRILSEKDYSEALVDKLSEEYCEFNQSVSCKEFVEESADVLEVIYTLKSVLYKKREKIENRDFFS